MPAFGVKIDAVPGRLNETWFGPVKKEGVYYGQCSELCGIRHGFMPIAVEVVSKAKFDAWAKAAVDDADDAQIQLLSALAKDGKALASTSAKIKIAAKPAASENN